MVLAEALIDHHVEIIAYRGLANRAAGVFFEPRAGTLWVINMVTDWKINYGLSSSKVLKTDDA